MKKRENNQTNPETASRKQKPKSKLGNVLFNLFIVLAFIIGLGVLLYPTFSDWWNQRREASLITEYKTVIAQIDDDTYRLMMDDARAYNAQHLKNTFTDAFEGEEGYMLHHPYDQLLDPTGSHIMGYIDVPKIGQRLTIGHGTGTAVLERGVGHVEGSSLPVGGENTHAVLAGHRGLPSAKIFTDADQLVKGDKFFLYVLDETLAYEIDQIEIVTPYEDQFLQIEEGQDLVTLLTCTPYGVNSHRMLIRGHRIPFVEADIQDQARQRTLPERERPIIIAVAALIIFFILLIIVRLILAARDRKKREQQMLAQLKELTDTVKSLEDELRDKNIQETETTLQETRETITNEEETH